ncbi:hypothetical protein glysoja_002262 [Glycine soja]|nr:hypothetical protein glysoja_002262 [Glycine soja]
MCIRDDHGRLIKARTQWNYRVPHLKEAEEWALLQGLWVQEPGYHSIIIEVDCKSLVDGLMGCNNKKYRSANHFF